MSEQSTYTLAEAKHELQRRECATFGHSWDVIATLSGPVAIVCACGVKYRVVNEGEVDA